MSFPAIAWALRQRILRSSEKFLLVCMCNYADEHSGQCFMSMAQLMQDSAQDRKTVLANMQRLIAAGLVRDTGRRTGRTGSVIVYEVIGSPRQASSNDGKNGTASESSSTENGTASNMEAVPNFPPSGPVFPMKRSQKRDRDPIRNLSGNPLKNPPPPQQGGNRSDAQTSRRVSREVSDRSLDAWSAACRVIDAIRSDPSRSKTWNDARAQLADPRIELAIRAAGGHKLIADRDKFTQGDLKRRFRAAFEEFLTKSNGAGSVPELQAMADNATKAMR